MTRREFTQLLLTLPVAPLIAQEGSDRGSPPEPEAAWRVVVEAVRGEPMEAAIRQRVATALKAQNELLARLRQFHLPEGSEPAFVFQPVPARRKGGAR